MIQGSWFKMPDNILREGAIVTEPNDVLVLVVLMSRAQRNEGPVRYKKRDHWLKEGEVCVSQNDIAKATKLTRDAVRASFKRLSKYGILPPSNSPSESKEVPIYFINLSAIQSPEPPSNSPSNPQATPKQPPTDQEANRLTGSENTEPSPTSEPSLGKTEPVHKGSGARASRGTRLPENWFPSDEEIQFAIGKGYTEQKAMEIGEKFRDYWIATSGQKGVKMNWTAVWRNWIRQERNSNPNGATRHGNQRNGSGSIDDAIKTAAGGLGMRSHLNDHGPLAIDQMQQCAGSGEDRDIRVVDEGPDAVQIIEAEYQEVDGEPIEI